MDCIVREITKSWTQLSDFHFHFSEDLSTLQVLGGLPRGSAGKEFTCNVRDLGSIPGLG